MKYAKRITPTPEIKAAIKRINAGADINTDEIAIYETRTINGLPLVKQGSLFNGGVAQPSLMHDMVMHLNASNEGVPIHLMHERGLLNVGKAFRARLDNRADGSLEVSTQYYIPLSETGLISRLDTGAVDQVSVGVYSQKIKCSHCEFDWKAATFDNLMDMTCDNGHTIGEDGVHVELHGLESWPELSLVDKGAAQDARIISADQSRFQDASEFYRLAANNQNNLKTNSIGLIKLASLNLDEELDHMDKEAIQALIDASLAAAAATAKEKSDAELKVALDAKQAELDAATAKVTELEAALAASDGAKVTELTDANVKLSADNEAMLSFLRDEAHRASVAANKPVPAAEFTTFEKAVAGIKDSGILIAKLYARETADHTQLEAAKDKISPEGLAAFKAPKR